MPTSRKQIRKFNISEDELRLKPAIESAYLKYFNKHYNAVAAREEERAAQQELHAVLDADLRLQGLVPEGKEWTLTENVNDGIYVIVWDEPRKRPGRKKTKLAGVSSNST